MRKWRIVLILGLCLFLLTGCTQASSLKERLIVQCIGVDRTETGVRLSVNAFQSKGVEAGEENSGENLVLSAEGETMTRAVENLKALTGKEPFFSHNRAILLGEDTARQGTEEIFRFFNGNYQNNCGVPVFLTRGSAETVLQDPALLPLLKQEWDAPAVYRVGESLLLPGGGVCLPVLTLEADTARLFGYGMLKEGRLVGFLSPEEELGYRTLRGRLSSLLVEEVPAEVKISAMETYLRCRDTTPTMDIRINLRGELVDEITGYGGITEEETLRTVTRACEEKLTRAVQTVLRGSANKYGTDLFHLTSRLERRMPAFEDLPAAEVEKILRGCKFEITVAMILRSKAAALGEN